MKKAIAVLMVIFSSLSLFSQPRTNPDDAYIITSQSQLISLPIGWYYSPFDEKWCGYYGLTMGEYKGNHKIPKRLTADALSGAGDRGIYSLQVKKAIVNQETFYLLYHVYWTGEYDYPAIERGWRYWKDCNIYVIPEIEYEKLNNLQNGINKINILDIVMVYKHGTASGNNNAKAQLNEIFRGISAPDRYNAKFKDYVMYVKLEDDNTTVRFQIPTDDKLWCEAQQENEDNERRKANGEIYHYWQNYETDCVNYDREYYEITKQQLSMLLIK